MSGRLTEEGYKVLLVEAGGPPHYLQYLPAMFSSFLSDPSSRYAWPHVTTPHQGALNAYKDNQIFIKTGKSLGETFHSLVLFQFGNITIFQVVLAP